MLITEVVIATNLKLAMNHSLGFPSPAHFRYGCGERVYYTWFKITCFIPHFGSRFWRSIELLHDHGFITAIACGLASPTVFVPHASTPGEPSGISC